MGDRTEQRQKIYDFGPPQSSWPSIGLMAPQVEVGDHTEQQPEIYDFGPAPDDPPSWQPLGGGKPRAGGSATEAYHPYKLYGLGTSMAPNPIDLVALVTSMAPNPKNVYGMVTSMAPNPKKAHGLVTVMVSASCLSQAGLHP